MGQPGGQGQIAPPLLVGPVLQGLPPGIAPLLIGDAPLLFETVLPPLLFGPEGHPGVIEPPPLALYPDVMFPMLLFQLVVVGQPGGVIAGLVTLLGIPTEAPLLFGRLPPPPIVPPGGPPLLGPLAGLLPVLYPGYKSKGGHTGEVGGAGAGAGIGGMGQPGGQGHTIPPLGLPDGDQPAGEFTLLPGIALVLLLLPEYHPDMPGPPILLLVIPPLLMGTPPPLPLLLGPIAAPGDEPTLPGPLGPLPVLDV